MSDDRAVNKGKPVLESKEFRTAFVSSFRIRARDNDFSLTLGAELCDPEGKDFIQDEFRAVMTPRSAKILMRTLQEVLGKFEAALGTIQLPPGKEEEIQRAGIEKGPRKAGD